MNWKARVEKALKTKHFTEEDRKLAALWITCPISEVADKITLKHNSLSKGPKDIYLVLDGIFFTKGVEDDDVDVALASNCYLSIQKRVSKYEL